jgi:hypothetical protein
MKKLINKVLMLWDKKLVVFIEFKKEIFWTIVLKMAVKG